VSLSSCEHMLIFLDTTGCVVNDMNENLVDAAVEDRPID